jgi:hypothetical protein
MALLLREKEHVASASAKQEWLKVRPTQLGSHVDYQTISLMAQKNQKAHKTHEEVELVENTRVELQESGVRESLLQVPPGHDTAPQPRK